MAKDKALPEFTPGEGILPPHLSGRGRDLGLLSKFAAKLRRGSPPRGVVLFGPRGNGKTVLLETFIRKLGEETDGSGSSPRILDISASDIQNMNELCDLLSIEGEPGVLDRISERIESVRIGGTLPDGSGAGVDLSLRQPQRKVIGLLAGVLAEHADVRPLVITIDEAQNLDPAVGHRLLNSVQQARRKDKPIMLILAGTPDLKRHLAGMKVTFWERGKKIRVGLLDGDAARDALVKPFQDAGIDFDETAIGEVVEESQGYPFFLQLWGDALVDALEGERRIEMRHVARAREVFEQEKKEFYEIRYGEVMDLGLLKAASAIAGHFEENSAAHSETIVSLLNEGLPEGTDANTALNSLVGLGYVWTNDDGDYIPGIPNLMRHCQKKYRQKLL